LTVGEIELSAKEFPASRVKQLSRLENPR